MKHQIRINPSLTEQVVSLLTELDFRFTKNERLAYCGLLFNTKIESYLALNKIEEHFGTSALLM